MVKAPGTYHHSIVIGSLVEAAAEAIGANPLLARVMAYYHDVGKMERPLYFIENQGGGYNRHDSLQPHMSAMIIRDHVKKGQELGNKFKLPRPLIDAMSEHHGSSTIWYFYNKADAPESVLESDYKYDGQKPQSKETALVMLGDVVEAATRSVADPTPLRLSGVVRNILNKYFAEGQLSECDLTLRDLDLIARSFLDVLLGIYHARIEYGVSSIRDNAKKKHGSSDTKGGSRPPSGSGVASTTGAAHFVGPLRIQSTGSSGSKKS
jgi:putative nucleotidyltransferase with HDIG domain